MAPSSFQRYLVTIIVSSLIIAMLITVLWWLRAKIETSRATLEESQNRVMTLEGERSQARLLASMLKKRAHDLERVRALLIIDRERPVAFIEAMEGMARRIGSTVKLTINPNKQEAGILAFQVVITGSEASVLTMLRAIELMPYEISIDELRFQGNREAAGAMGHAVRTLGGGGSGGRDDSTTIILNLRVKTL